MRQWMNGFLLFSMLGLAASAVAGENDVQVQASYQLPETDAFRGFGLFDLRIQGAQFDGDRLRVRYEVPPDLIGKNNRFMTMRGRLSDDGQSMNLFCGETGSTAQCSYSDQHLTCAVQFRNLTPDADLVESFLTSKYGENDANLFERISASSAFAGDAIGTLNLVID